MRTIGNVAVLQVKGMKNVRTDVLTLAVLNSCCPPWGKE
jgi:hypothetical protein